MVLGIFKQKAASETGTPRRVKTPMEERLSADLYLAAFGIDSQSKKEGKEQPAIVHHLRSIASSVGTSHDLEEYQYTPNALDSQALIEDWASDKDIVLDIDTLEEMTEVLNETYLISQDKLAAEGSEFTPADESAPSADV